MPSFSACERSTQNSLPSGSASTVHRCPRPSCRAGRRRGWPPPPAPARSRRPGYPTRNQVEVDTVLDLLPLGNLDEEDVVAALGVEDHALLVPRLVGVAVHVPDSRAGPSTTRRARRRWRSRQWCVRRSRSCPGVCRGSPRVVDLFALTTGCRASVQGVSAARARRCDPRLNQGSTAACSHRCQSKAGTSGGRGRTPCTASVRQVMSCQLRDGVPHDLAPLTTRGANPPAACVDKDAEIGLQIRGF